MCHHDGARYPPPYINKLTINVFAPYPIFGRIWSVRNQVGVIGSFIFGHEKSKHNLKKFIRPIKYWHLLNYIMFTIYKTHIIVIRKIDGSNSW